MSDNALIVLFAFAFAALAGAFGGALGGACVCWLRTRWPKIILAGLDAEHVLPLRITLQDVPAISVPVRVSQPDPVTVEIATTGAPSARELAARVLAVYPDIGPTALAEIAGCGKSTAHAIIGDYRAGRLQLPEAPNARDTN